jgi:hypothetical protein
LLNVGAEAAPDAGGQAALPGAAAAASSPPALPFGVTVKVHAPKGCTTPFLRSWSAIVDMQNRLKELGDATYGSKDVMWKRLVEYETVRQNKEREQSMLEARCEELALMVDPVVPKLLAGPAAPSEHCNTARQEAGHPQHPGDCDGLWLLAG